jgi:ADP-heptose:LPS heptosyltransferase
MKIMGFNIGQYGDLALNTIACGVMKKQFPNCYLSFAISKKYYDCHEVFLNNNLIDEIFLIEGYDNFPTMTDLKNIKEKKFDIIFESMPQHQDAFWFTKRHQAQEVCVMHNIQPPQQLEDLKIKLNKYWNDNKKYNDYVAVAPFGSFGEVKSLNKNKINNIINYLKNKKLKVLLVKGLSDPILENIDETTEGTYFDSIKKVTSCKSLITVDTGMNWFASAYDMNVIGLYGYKYYPYCNTSKNWQPINKNAVYLEAPHCNQIEDKLIFTEIDKI